MTDSSKPPGASRSIQKISQHIFRTLSRAFPVMCSSDEFHFFPQVPPGEKTVGNWDDLSPDSIGDVCRNLALSERELENLLGQPLSGQERADARLGMFCASVARGELETVGHWRRQPTMYLSIVTIGLAEALEADSAPAWEQRIEALPGFLHQAAANIEAPPGIFVERGIEMCSDARAWISSLTLSMPGTAEAVAALDSFDRDLRAKKTSPDFGLPPDHFDLTVRWHMGARMSPSQAMEIIEREIGEMERIMREEARALAPGADWRAAMDRVPLPPVKAGGLLELYREQVAMLGQACLDLGLIGEDLHAMAPVTVEPIPSYLAAVRSAAAYGARPGHPPRGGTFYLMDHDVPPDLYQALHRDCRMLAAHETFPGHHLLDTFRWNNKSLARRHIEWPLFYEGWACFAEELMLELGVFDQPHDRLIMARRNYWRAMRGKIDLSIQAGEMSLEQAALHLEQAGMDPERARHIPARYALKPGYQTCYTVGGARFRKLFSDSGQDPARLARRVLEQGEILFDDLSQALLTDDR